MNEWSALVCHPAHSTGILFVQKYLCKSCAHDASPQETHYPYTHHSSSWTALDLLLKSFEFFNDKVLLFNRLRSRNLYLLKNVTAYCHLACWVFVDCSAAEGETTQNRLFLLYDASGIVSGQFGKNCTRKVDSHICQLITPEQSFVKQPV